MWLQCWADPTLAQQLLGWSAQHGVDRMCEDAWRWQNGEARTLKNAI
jgi:UDP-glucose 4-epimerase